MLLLNRKKIQSMNFIPAALSLLLSIGTLTIFHACEIKEDGTWMHCHEAQNAAVIGGLLLTVLLAIVPFLQNKSAKTILSGLCVVGAVVVFLIPGTIISMCMMQTMRCYTVMQPFTRILSAIIAALCLIQTIRTVRN